MRRPGEGVSGLAVGDRVALEPGETWLPLGDRQQRSLRRMPDDFASLHEMRTMLDDRCRAQCWMIGAGLNSWAVIYTMALEAHQALLTHMSWYDRLSVDRDSRCAQALWLSEVGIHSVGEKSARRRVMTRKGAGGWKKLLAMGHRHVSGALQESERPTSRCAVRLSCYVACVRRHPVLVQPSGEGGTVQPGSGHQVLCYPALPRIAR